MPSVADCLRELNDLVPLDKAAGWDAVGLQVGAPDAVVERIAVCHEVTSAVTTALERDPVDLVITYHPLLFRAASTFVAGAHAAGRAFRLARAGVAVASVHTAFDVAPGGAADALAETLGLTDVAGFGPGWGSDAAKVVTFVPAESVDDVSAAMTDAGGGRIGKYTGCSYRVDGVGAFTPGPAAQPTVGTSGEVERAPEVRIEMIVPAPSVDLVVAALVGAHPYEEPAYDVYDVRANAGFVGRLGRIEQSTLAEVAYRAATSLECTPRVAGAPDGSIEQVAVVPGSGGSFVPAAAGSADVLITGDVSHHQARSALDRGLGVIDVGHVPGERPGLLKLYAAVAHLDLPVRRMLEFDPDPWS